MFFIVTFKNGHQYMASDLYGMFSLTSFKPRSSDVEEITIHGGGVHGRLDLAHLEVIQDIITIQHIMGQWVLPC